MFWGEIDGDTADKRDDCWDALDKLVFQPFKHERFGEIRAAAISIDSSDGGTSNAVYLEMTPGSFNANTDLAMNVYTTVPGGLHVLDFMF